MGSAVICPDCFDRIRNEVRFSVSDFPLLPGTSQKIHKEIRSLPGKQRLHIKMERKGPSLHSKGDTEPSPVAPTESPLLFLRIVPPGEGSSRAAAALWILTYSTSGKSGFFSGTVIVRKKEKVWVQPLYVRTASMGSGMRCAFPFQMPHCLELRGRFTMRSGFSREKSTASRASRDRSS